MNQMLNVEKVAELLDLSPKTLAHWRCNGTGPRHARIGGRILYDPADISSWVEARKVQSTSETVA